MQEHGYGGVTCESGGTGACAVALVWLGLSLSRVEPWYWYDKTGVCYGAARA